MKNSRLEEFEEIDSTRRELLSEVEGLRNKRKTASTEIGKRRKAGEDAEELMAGMRAVGDRIKELEAKLSAAEETLSEIVMGIPNLCHDDLPVGNSDADNVEFKSLGDVPQFSLNPSRIGRSARLWGFSISSGPPSFPGPGLRC